MEGAAQWSEADHFWSAHERVRERLKERKEIDRDKSPHHPHPHTFHPPIPITTPPATPLARLSAPGLPDSFLARLLGARACRGGTKAARAASDAGAVQRPTAADTRALMMRPSD